MPPFHTSPLAYFAAGAAAFSFCTIVYTRVINPIQHIRTTPSPRTHADSLSLTGALPYPRSDFPARARDVDTPYGTMRVYELGPEDATRKVLLIHGISTPCPALAPIAELLVEKGCRVMLFDLFGRGWSDHPADLPYDDRLYTSQILLALASSPVSWTGGPDGGFSVIGYSLGGGIAANFTSYFPTLVEDLVLIAPAGLIRPTHRDWKTAILYSGYLPQRLVAHIVTSRLTATPNNNTSQSTLDEKPLGVDAPTASAEVANIDSLPRAFGRTFDPQAIVDWQIKTHAGFAPAFISSIQDAPISGQNERWRTIGQRLDSQRGARNGSSDGHSEKQQQGLRIGKVLMVLGRTDSAILTAELEVDAKEAFGAHNVDILIFEAGHEVHITHGRELVEWVWERWGADVEKCS